MNKDFMNLKWDEYHDLQELIQFYKKWDGYSPIKLNWFDRLVAKEHEYGYSRCFPGMTWFMFGFWLIPWFICVMAFNHPEWTIVFWIFIPMITISLLYHHSCNKIDYNALCKKNAQMNLFSDFGVKYKYSNSWIGYGKDKRK